MKRLGLVLTGALATAGFAHAATLGPNLQATPAMHGASVPLGATAIAQMTDNTPVSQGSVACSDHVTGTTFDNSWWRRFYLAEHGAPSSVTIDSVMVGAETGTTPVTIRLYTIPHSVAAGTLPLAQLSLIGSSALTSVTGNLDTTTIPVIGTVADAIGHDLVVEYHTDGNSSSAFYAGGNPSAQTHEAFFSSTDCDVPEPTPMSGVGFPDAHIIIVANAAAPGIALTKTFAPNLVNASTPSKLTITLVNPFATPASLMADLIDSFPSGLEVAATPNASTTCGGAITAIAGSNSVSLAAAGSSIPALGHCTLTVDVSSTGGVHDNVIDVGGLQTDLGGNAHAARATLTVIPPGGNGILQSGPVNRALAATRVGTSYNMVSSATNDAGPQNAGWDFNFSFGANYESADLAVLTFNTIAANMSEYLVDARGNVRVLQDGDVVGPTGMFSAEDAVPADLAWLAGTDSWVGVRFRCSGRLSYPVMGDLCYGAIRIATTNTIGFPARLVESAFDGDGQPFTVVAAAPVNPPAATLAPSSLAFSVAADTTRTQTLSITNADGSHPLHYAIAAQGESAALVPHVEDLAKVGSQPLTRQPMLSEWSPPSRMPVSATGVRGFAAAPWQVPGGIPFVLDDGSYENVVGLGQIPAVWLNRFSVLDAMTLNSVSILWPRQTEGGSIVGLQANIVAYYDASGSGDARNAVRLGGDHLVTIETLDTFSTYATDFVVPGAGDVYVGFVEHWAMEGYPFALYAAAIDSDSLQGHSYLSLTMSDEMPPALDITNLANNDFTGSLVAMTGGYLGGNWLIRATGSGAACSGPAVPWLTATSIGSQVVVGGASAAVMIKADPAAGNLAPGTYTAELCIASNDPDRHVIAVPVSLEVTAPMAAHGCGIGSDVIFCSGFESLAGPSDIVSSGMLNLSLPRTNSGLSFNFARDEWSEHAFFGDDFAPYWSDMAPFLMFHWHADVMPGANGGVAETALGPYRVLQSGDTIGAASTFSAVANGSYGETALFLAGVDGYLGFKFLNEETGQTNYGYMRLITTWPTGYPATLVEYAYDKSGSPITIP